MYSDLQVRRWPHCPTEVLLKVYFKASTSERSCNLRARTVSALSPGKQQQDGFHDHVGKRGAGGWRLAMAQLERGMPFKDL